MPGASRRLRLHLALPLALWAGALRAQVPAEDVTIVPPPQAMVVLDRNGGLLGEVGTESRTWVRLVDLPPFVGHAFIAVEDHRFYQHDGVDVVGVIGALRDNILRGGRRPRGASTITQQLVGAMGLVDRRDITLDRKLREATLARALERRHTKSEILEAYLNYINFGHGWYGIEAASRHYFGKHAAELSLAEAATLAAMPRSPVAYDPRAHPEASVRRRNTVLQLMQDERYITAAQMRAARNTRTTTVPDDGYSVRAPYVVEWVRQWMVERYGLRAVNTSGMLVRTTVDPAVQLAANTAIAEGLARVENARGYRWPRFGAPGVAARAGRTPYLQGALVAIDPANGQVLALVGGRDFRDSEFNRATQGVRQAGSAFKPFVYATAFSEGRPPTMILADTPLVVRRAGSPAWMPENSDGRWSGPVTARTALMQSINVPAIRLAQSLGMDSVIATARRFGLTTDIPPYLPTAIGAADVHPIEMVSAYGALAMMGQHVPPRIVTRVADASGSTMYEAAELPPDTVVDPRVAYQVVSILQDAVNLGTGTAARAAVGPALPFAGKTGTTNDNADVWFIGFTRDLVAGVWLGFDRPQTIARGAYGGTLAAPIWGAFAHDVYAERPVPPDWEAPPGLVAVRVRRRDGVPVRPGESGAATVMEYFEEGTEPTAPAIMRQVIRRLLQPWPR